MTTSCNSKPCPLHHGDPFDRLLIAQAIVRDTSPSSPADKKFKLYDVKVIW